RRAGGAIRAGVGAVLIRRRRPGAVAERQRGQDPPPEAIVSEGRDVVVEVGVARRYAEARAAGPAVVEALGLAERIRGLDREGAVRVVDRAAGARRDAGAADGGGLTVAERVQ